MEKLCKLLIILITILVLFIDSSYAAGPAEKLGRGLANTFTGWVEVPATISQKSEEHGWVGGSFYGLPVGLFKAVLRTGAGIYEVFTFPFAVPKDYEPVMEPEFVLESPMQPME